MIEKFLFKSIELWIALLMLLFAIIASILFGWVVRHTVAGRNKAGFIGEIAVTIASTPSNLKILLTGPEDYISDGIISLYDLSSYKNVLHKKTTGPKYFSSHARVSLIISLVGIQ